MLLETSVASSKLSGWSSWTVRAASWIGSPARGSPVRYCAGWRGKVVSGVIDPESSAAVAVDHLEDRARHVAGPASPGRAAATPSSRGACRGSRAPCRCSTSWFGSKVGLVTSARMRPVFGSIATTAPRSLPSRRSASDCSRTSTERCEVVRVVGIGAELAQQLVGGAELVEPDQLAVHTFAPGRPSRRAGSCSRRSAPSPDAGSARTRSRWTPAWLVATTTPWLS